MPVLVNLWNPRLMSFSNSKQLTALVLICLSLLITGCGNNFGFPGVYRIDVEQGNIVTTDMVDQLQPGMTRRQVRFILGTPLIEDTFSPDRWDYRYTKRNGNDTLTENRLTVYFEGDKLVNVVGQEVPEWARPEENPKSAEDVTAS